MENMQIYADDISERASEDYNPYDYVYEFEDNSHTAEKDIESFVWDVDE